MDVANGMTSYYIGYQMDHHDPKQLDFVIYLVLRMHQFQKYHLLRKYFTPLCINSKLRTAS